jgi:hypothetical protein
VTLSGTLAFLPRPGCLLQPRDFKILKVNFFSHSFKPVRLEFNPSYGSLLPNSVAFPSLREKTKFYRT